MRVSSKNEKMLFPYGEGKTALTNVYNHIVDDVSKKIFLNRFMLSVTSDIKYLRKLILLTEGGKKLNERLNKGGPIYIYGAGIRGTRLAEMFAEKNIVGFVDKVKRGHYGNLPILSLGEFKERFSTGIIVISNLEDGQKIGCDILELLAGKIEESQIVFLDDYEDINIQEQYFEKRCINHYTKSRGTFVDAGCYDGSETIKWLKMFGDRCENVYAFEPDKENYEICKKNFEGLAKVTLLEYGLSNKKEKLFFAKEGALSSHFEQDGKNGNERLVCISLDSILENQQVGTIKMDIEGMEEKALLGAEKIIKKHTPDLAICVYHKREDIIEIPQLLLEMNPNYHFALGHYSMGIVDTVLYAFNKL